MYQTQLLQETWINLPGKMKPDKMIHSCSMMPFIFSLSLYMIREERDS